MTDVQFVDGSTDNYHKYWATLVHLNSEWVLFRDSNSAFFFFASLFHWSLHLKETLCS